MWTALSCVWTELNSVKKGKFVDVTSNWLQDGKRATFSHDRLRRQESLRRCGDMPFPMPSLGSIVKLTLPVHPLLVCVHSPRLQVFWNSLSAINFDCTIISYPCCWQPQGHRPESWAAPLLDIQASSWDHISSSQTSPAHFCVFIPTSAQEDLGN